jgi:uncharacterized protein DUF4189
MGMRRGAVVSLLALASVFSLGNRAYSEGAIAEGIAPGGVAKGYMIAIRTDRPNSEAARSDALAGCKKRPEKVLSGVAPDDGNAKARARCEVVSTFSKKCAATAADPKDGTPGAGWAVGDTQQQADEEALARCRSVAGTDRRDFCKVTSRACDGSAK